MGPERAVIHERARLDGAVNGAAQPGMQGKCDRTGNPAIPHPAAPGPEALRPRFAAGLRKLAKTIAPAINNNQLYESCDMSVLWRQFDTRATVTLEPRGVRWHRILAQVSYHRLPRI